METSMQNIREMIGANAIVGEQITTPDGITLIPVSKVTFGVAGGGSDSAKKQDKNVFGGGTGAGVNIIPVAFLVIKEGKVDMLYISPPATSTVEKILDAVPDVIDKVTDFLNKDKEEE